MRQTSPTWKWMLADGGKGLPAAEYTGAAVSFDNPGHNYPKALSVAIEPVQSGSGDPSPDNVRPISGWTGANIHVSPTEDAQDGKTYSITFPAEAGTVYGGTLDVTTGLLTVDRAIVGDFTGLRSMGRSSSGAYRYQLDLENVPTFRESQQCASNVLSYYTVYSDAAANTFYNGSNRFFIYLNAPTTAEAIAWLESNSVVIVYPLTTPVTYQLDPVAVALLQGLNTIWADAGDVTVSLGALGDVQLEAVAEIGGTTYTDLPAAPVVNRALMQGGLSVGNAVSASCALSIRTADSIPRAAEVLLKVRLTDGVTTSEWLPMGTFYISHRSVDPVTGILSLECYDALLKANAPWEPAEGDLPMSMADAAEALAELLGVELDSRSAIATGAIYVIDSLSEGETIRDTLSRIAVANGGNWIITPANKLRLVPLLDAADASAATADALDVGGVTGGISVHPASTVTGIRYGGEGEGAVLGDDTGTVIDIGDNAAFLQPLFDQLVGLTFRPFELNGAVYDPAAELGDYVRAGAGGEVASVLHSEVATYGPGFTGNLSAPQGGELADEYPYIGGAANKALLAARAYARQISEALDHSLTQQEVFDRLTGNGAAQGLFLTQDGQLYINASYIYSGLLTLGGLNNQNGTMRVLDASGNVICTLNNTGVDITEGSVATYSQDRLTRAILSDGQVSIQYWGQDSGTGQYRWKDMLAITADSNGSAVRGSTGALTLRGQDAIHLTNRSGTTDTVYATADMEDAAVTLRTWSAPGGTYEGDSTFEMGPEGIRMSVGDGDPTKDDPAVELSRNGLEANVKRVDVTATDGGLNFTATYTDLSGEEHTGTMAYDGVTLDVEGALNVSDPAGTRANLGIELHELVLTSQTVDANGNIDTGLNAGTCVVVSARCSSYIVTPWVSGSTSTWWAHLTTFTGAAVSSGTSVGTVRVYYYDL